MICRYIIWRNNHAYDERLRRIVDRANVASRGTRSLILSQVPGLLVGIAGLLAVALRLRGRLAGQGRRWLRSRRGWRLSGCGPCRAALRGWPGRCGGTCRAAG
jgi:hypothetical protein